MDYQQCMKSENQLIKYQNLIQEVLSTEVINKYINYDFWNQQ